MAINATANPPKKNSAGTLIGTVSPALELELELDELAPEVFDAPLLSVVVDV